MRDKTKKYRDGFVKIQMKSPYPERFLRLCANNQLLLWNIKNVDDHYEFELSIKDFYRLQPFRRKTNAKIKIMEKHGMPFFFKKNKKRKAFFIGLGLAAIMLYLCSLYIWEIKIEGNQYYTDETIQNELKERKITQGVKKSSLDCGKIAEQLREDFSELVWVSVKIKGTSLVVDVKENENQDVVSSESSLLNWDLVARKDGIVKKIITRKGMPMLEEGDICKKGDVLVSGKVEILDNDSMVKDYSYVGADATIWIETNYSYYEEFDLHYEEKIYEKKTYTYPVIRVGEYSFSYIPKKFQQAEMIQQLLPLRLTENFYLPICIGKNVIYPFQVRQQTYTEEEALYLADIHLKNYLEKMVENEIVILDKNISSTITSEKCITKGVIYVLEEAVEKKKISTEILIDDEQIENS